MATEDDGGVSLALPSDVDDWVAETADRRDESREAVCRHILTAAHAVATADGDGPDPTALADADALDGLQEQLDAQREEVVELLEDVRSRVIQVKRETDAKAPDDHDHPGAAAERDALRADLGDLEATVDAGFENFEDVLTYLLAETDDLDDRSAVLATAVLDLRDRWDEFAARERRRAEADRLQQAANRLGTRTATCEDCDASVDLALLNAPECPHCASRFADVREKSSFFGSHTLETDDPPALRGRAEDATPTASEVFDAVAETAADDDSSDSGDGDDGDNNDTVDDDDGNGTGKQRSSAGPVDEPVDTEDDADRTFPFDTNR